MVSETRRWAAMPLLFALASQALADITYKGCFSSSTPLTQADTYTYQSTGHCSGLCLPNSPVMGLTAGNGCWCGTELPAASSLVDDSKCSTPCTGYGTVNCGGTNYWSVYLTGTSNDVTNYGASPDSTSSSSSSTSTTPSTVTSVSPGNTVLVTVSASASASPSSTNTSTSSGSGTSVAGVAAGVVVGVIAVAAICAGIFFFLRHRRRQQAEEDYKRSVQVSDFMRGAGERKAPNTAYSQMSDSRLDPEAGRRNSVGSMADEHDYSRRILRVANPDSH